MDQRRGTPRRGSVTGQPTSEVLGPDQPLELTFNEDFMICSEFSELVGPVCLQVIPENGAGKFDISRFVLKIMSVDHQAKSGESGVFGEDTQVVFFEPMESAWCYVHHLTLLDIHARGYVRPICLTYITSDAHKVMSNFKGLLKHFTAVSTLLKTGNYELFRDDLKKRMADLAYTKGVVDTMEGASMVTAATPGIITRHFEDMKKMRQKMKRATHILPEDDMEDDVDISSFTTSGMKKNNSNNNLSNGDGAATITSSQDNGKTLGRGKRGENLMEGEFNEDDDDDVNDDDVKTPVSNTVAAEEEREEEEEEEEEDDDHLGEIMVNIVRALGIDQDYKPRVIQSLHKTRTLSSNLRSLKELCGGHFDMAMEKLEKMRRHFCRPSLALALEEEDCFTMSPVCSALVIGGVPMLNFNWQADRNLLYDARLVSSTTSASETSEEDYDFKSFTAGTSNWSMEMIDQTMAYAHGVVLASRPSSRPTSTILPGKHLLVVDNAPESVAPQVFIKDELLPLGSASLGFSNKIWPSSFTKSPDALLLRRFSFSKHALYSLLKGRPLIVCGLNQETVMGLVSAFQLVVAYYGSNAVTNPWLDRPLRVSDLAHLVLVGVPKTHKIPAGLVQYVSVLDADSGTLDAPAYSQGRLLDGICDPQRRWSSSETYLAFVYAELFEISTLAGLYYYSCCVGTPMDGTPGNDDEKFLKEGRFTTNMLGTTFRKSLSTQHAAPLMEQSPSQFWKENRLGACDAQILQHLGEVVKEQQAQELYGAGNAAPMIKLDYSKCERFSDPLGTVGSSGSLSASMLTPPRSFSAPGTPSSRQNSLTPKKLFK